MTSVNTLKKSELVREIPIKFWGNIPTHCEYCSFPLDMSPVFSYIKCVNQFCPSLKLGKIKKILAESNLQIEEEQLKKIALKDDVTFLNIIESIDGLQEYLDSLNDLEFISLVIGWQYSNFIDIIFESENVVSIPAFLKKVEDLQQLQEQLLHNFSNMDDMGRDVLEVSIVRFYESIFSNKEVLLELSKKR